MIDLNTAFIQSLGPVADGIVGTDGQYQDLYEAMEDAGGPQWTKVIAAVGCTMSQAVTLTSAVSIIALANRVSIGARVLRIEGANSFVSNIRIDSSTANGIEIDCSRVVISNCMIDDATGIGIKVETGDYIDIIGCNIYANGGDGIELDDGTRVRCIRNRVQSNGGWGIDDNNSATNYTMFIGNFWGGNSSGELSTSALAAYQLSNIDVF